MIDNGKDAGSKPFIKFVKTKGSQVSGRYKDKRERINEAMCDLKLAIDGIGAQSTQSEEFDQLPQSAAALARACSIFLRKMVIGDMNKANTRLLDSEMAQALDMKFDRLRKISSKRRSLDITWNIVGGMLQLTKLDEDTRLPQAVYNMPVTPLELKIAIEWPLPGTANWNEVPTEKKPWEVRPEELFDPYSSDTLNCDEWLGQQLVIFDNKGISLKDVIRTIVTYEGAHSTNVSRLIQTENEKDSKPTKNPEVHILNNVKVCGIKYNHIVLIECALYLYKKLAKKEGIGSPEDELCLPIICLLPESSEDIFSSSRSWLSYDGGIILSFGENKQRISHRIRAVK